METDNQSCGNYHTDLDGNLILDEDGLPIPTTICLCHAFEPNECVCGAWDDAADWWYEEEGGEL
jgi:hypothetical protein